MESDGDESKRGEPHLHSKCGLSEKVLGFTGLKCRGTVAGALCMDGVAIDGVDLRMTIYNGTFVNSLEIGSQHVKDTLVNKFSVHIISQCCELYKIRISLDSMTDYLNYRIPSSAVRQKHANS